MYEAFIHTVDKKKIQLFWLLDGFDLLGAFWGKGRSYHPSNDLHKILTVTAFFVFSNQWKNIINIIVIIVRV